MADKSTVNISFKPESEEHKCMFGAIVRFNRITKAEISFRVICRSTSDVSFICNGVIIAPDNSETGSAGGNFISARYSFHAAEGDNTLEYSHPLYPEKRETGSFIHGKDRFIQTAFAELRQMRNLFENRNFSLDLNIEAPAGRSLFKNLILSPFAFSAGGKNNGEERGVSYKIRTRKRGPVIFAVISFGIDFPDRFSASLGRKRLLPSR